MGIDGRRRFMSRRKMVLLAHPGTQYSLNLARELHRHDILDGFHTCLAVSAESAWARLMTPLAAVLRVERQLQNRLVRDVPKGKLHCYPALEINSWWRLRRRSPATQVFRRRNDEFQIRIPEPALAHAEAVIGFDTSSQILAARTRTQQKRFILDRSIAHPRAYVRISASLKERFPEWSDSQSEKTEADFEIEDREHELAHLIVVPSRFVAESLIAQGVAKEKIRVNPFGTNLDLFRPVEEMPDTSNLIFLFVGALTARKGLPLLLEAWRELKPKNAELWIAGTGEVPTCAREQAPESVRWLGPISRQELPSLLRRAHVFVFPSYFEGLAQVQLEAAACALPIIATRASGGEEIVEEGETGFIIEPGCLAQLVARLSYFTEQRALVNEMNGRARAKRARWSWSAYGDRWQQILSEHD
jgi:starch synthase